MKHYFFFLLLLVLFGCENGFEDIYRYSKTISQSKTYPVYLDMSEIGKIQVKTAAPQVAPFKIVSNDQYYFVGDMLKGVHVYKKESGSLSYLCFIECQFIKDFDIVGSRLFCNNFTDMVVLDVSNPLQTSLLHRQKNHFNRFTSYKTEWNIPYVEGKGLIVGAETHELTGTVTEKQPDLDFSEYDTLYGNLTTKVLPESWFSGHPENDKPYVGIIKMNTDEIYTYGTYNSWAICAYRGGTFSVREEDLWTKPWGKYAPPYYYSNAFPVRMVFQDSIICVLGALNGLSGGYCDCNIFNENYPITFPFYFPGFKPLDICYMPHLNAFFVLSGTSILGVFITGNGIPTFSKTIKDYPVETDATLIFRIENNVLTLGKELKFYLPSQDELKLIKEYPEISGTCWSKAGDVLAVANTQGLFLYDITDPENIKLIP